MVEVVATSTEMDSSDIILPPTTMVTYYHPQYHYHSDADDAIVGYYQLKASLEAVETPALLSIGIVGFVGACFSLAIFLREPNDFFLYKIIFSSAAVQMLVLTVVRLAMYCHCERSYTCSFFWAHISLVISNLCADVVDFLILFLGVERTWACLLPFKFKNIDKRRLERTAVVFAFLITALFSVIHAFELTLKYDEDDHRYRDSPSEFADSHFYATFITINTIRFYATACAIVIATMFSVYGFWRTARRSLIYSPNRDKRREMDLCCLQLCTAAPVVVNHLLYAVSLRTGHFSFDQQQPHVVQLNESTGEWTWLAEDGRVLDPPDVMGRLRRAEGFEYLKTSTNLSDALAHALQFYFYLIFCLKVRQGFLALWTRHGTPDGSRTTTTAAANGYKPTATLMEEIPILHQAKNRRRSSNRCLPPPSPRRSATTTSSWWWRKNGTMSKDDECCGPIDQDGTPV